jgi:hypothetical protein
VPCPWAKKSRLDLDREQLLAAYAAHEARAELEHPRELYRDILARSFRFLGDELGAPVSDEEAIALAVSIPDWPAFEDSHDALIVLGERFKLIILSNVDRASFAASRARLGIEFSAVLTAEDVGSYKPSPRNFDALAAEPAASRSVRHSSCTSPRACFTITSQRSKRGCRPSGSTGATLSPAGAPPPRPRSELLRTGSSPRWPRSRKPLKANKAKAAERFGRGSCPIPSGAGFAASPLLGTGHAARVRRATTAE